jgi:hypothetical protein
MPLESAITCHMSAAKGHEVVMGGRGMLGC